MKGQPPKFDALESAGDKVWNKVGAAWETAREQTLSVKLDKPVTSFILVPHVPARKASVHNPEGPRPAA